MQRGETRRGGITTSTCTCHWFYNGRDAELRSSPPENGGVEQGPIPEGSEREDSPE